MDVCSAADRDNLDCADCRMCWRYLRCSSVEVDTAVERTAGCSLDVG